MNVENLMKLLEEVPYWAEINVLIARDDGQKIVTTNLGVAYQETGTKRKLAAPTTLWLLGEGPWKPAPSGLWISRVWPM